MVDEYTLSITVKAADLVKLPGLFRKIREVEMLCGVAASTAKLTGNRTVDVAHPVETDEFKYSIRVVGTTKDDLGLFRRVSAGTSTIDVGPEVSSFSGDKRLPPDTQPNIEQLLAEEPKSNE